MAVFFCLCVVLFFVRRYIKAHENPYKLTFIFGKKGAGKSCYMVNMMLKYQRAGWLIYTDMDDIRIPGVRIIKLAQFEKFRPEPHSAIFLDEVGLSMNNRNFKDFPQGLVEFWKYLRKMECCCFMNSQAFDVDKKVRDTVDGMVLIVAVANLVSIVRPVKRTLTLTEPTANAESRIADRLAFTGIWNWRFYWMPNYYRYFDSKAMPFRPFVTYSLPLNPIEIGKGVLYRAFAKVNRCLG